MTDKYDERGWCGDENIYETSKDDPFNRPCAAHDSGFVNKLYSLKRTNELFFKRMKAYEWLYDGEPEVRLRRGLFTGIVSAVGWIWWGT